MKQDSIDTLPRNLLDGLLEGCQVIGSDYRYRYVNDSAAKHGRTTVDQLIGRTMMEAYPNIEKTPMFASFRRCMEERCSVKMQNEFTFPDQSKGWFELRFEPIPEGVFILSIDITDLKEAESEVRRSNDRLRRLTRFVQDLSGARSLPAVTEVVREAARALAGSDGATFVLRDGDLCHYVDEDAIEPLWKGKKFPIAACISGWAMMHRQAVVIEDIYADDRIPHDVYRTTFVKSLVMLPVRHENPIGAIGVYWATHYRATEEDVRILQALADSVSVAMENLRIYRELEEEKARMRALHNHLPNPSFVWQRHGKGFVLVDANEAAKTLMQWSAENFFGNTPRDLTACFPNLEEDAAHCFEQRHSLRREVLCALPGERAQRNMVLTYGFVPDDMVILHAEDITEQRETENRLRLSQRLEAVGRLAGGVAHDFNNLLTVILGYLDFAIRELPASASIRADLLEAQQAGERAENLTRQLLAFSRKQVLAPTVLNLNKIVMDISGLLRRLLGEDVQIATQLAADLGSVRVDSGQVEQVIMNLVVNARDAMPQGGKLTIETSNVTLDDSYASQHISVSPGQYVLLAITDTGCGMDEATQDRIFEPFFTTKEKGKGTGLGLATVYGIVKQSGGSIWVYSEPGHGTSFKIYFPRVDAPAIELRRPAPPKVMASGQETLLLVEDDGLVRRLTERILKQAGYHVLVAANGSEALRLGEAQGKIDLLLTDVVMPQMSGPQIAERLVERYPEVKVLYTSGYTDETIVRHGVLEQGVHFVGKPFSASELTKKIRAVLDGKD